jgi:hypothetical protein
LNGSDPENQSKGRHHEKKLEKTWITPKTTNEGTFRKTLEKINKKDNLEKRINRKNMKCMKTG